MTLRDTVARAPQPLRLAALVVALASAWHATALAQRHRVDLAVVDVSGGRAYLSPGESAGVQQGSDIIAGRRHFRVVAVTATYCVVELGTQTLDVGDDARVATSEDTDEAPTGHPRPMSAFENQWPAAVHPADAQRPTPVPLGATTGRRRYDVVLSFNTMGEIPTSGPAEAIFRGDLRAQVYAEPFDGVPAWFRADVSGQLWAGGAAQRAGGDARPWLRVRELAVGYGSESAQEFFGVLGRIRTVAAGVGQLDGLRLRTPSFGGFTIGAFGGFVPDPRSGIPVFASSIDPSGATTSVYQSARFGLELGYHDYLSSIRPSVNLVAYGSLYNGSIDERRALLQFAFFPGSFRLGASAELSLYDQPNPWIALPLEVSSANVDAAYRIGNFDVGMRLDLRKPERSRWLADVLPSSWLCTALPTASATTEPCNGKDDSRYLASVDAGLRIDDVVLRGGATVVQYAQDAQLTQVGGYVSTRATRIVTDRLRADLFLSANIGALIDSYAGRVGVNVVIVPDLVDVGVHYRVSWNAYRASAGYFLQNAGGGSLNVRPTPDLAVMLVGEGISSSDFDVVLVSLNVAYRPPL